MSSVRQQALIDAPVEAVWELVGDPRRYPEWAANVIEVTGVPEVIEEGTTFRQETRAPIGSATTTFVVDTMDELREIRLRCLTSGYYSRWQLTAARDGTFADVEIGMEPTTLRFKAFDAVAGQRSFRRLVGQVVDGVRELAGRERPASPG